MKSNMITARQQWLCSLLLLVSARSTLAFSFSPTAARQLGVPKTSIMSLSSTSAATDYEIVKVDLSEGRDYPIYIGAGFSDEEGELCFC
jgi:hypothetical protein